VNDLSTHFVSRLRQRDPKAWFELWETFGPVLRAQLARWGRGRIGHETVQDLSQETLTALSGAIDRHDPERGARFSTWLLAIARHTLGDELDRRNAQKRGGGRRARSIDELEREPGVEAAPDADYEQAVFEAKVEAALRAVERSSDFLDFSIYRLRVLDGRSGREVAESLGTSPATVSRRLAGVRDQVRSRLQEIFSRFSFTPEELGELARNGIDPNPKKEDDARFDEAMGELYHRVAHRRSPQAGVGPA
jgi:RNA polymerase sigma factor (sigma-70 family)